MIRQISDEHPTSFVAPFNLPEGKSFSSQLASLILKQPESTAAQKAVEAWTKFFREPQIDALQMQNPRIVHKIRLKEVSHPEPFVCLMEMKLTFSIPEN